MTKVFRIESDDGSGLYRGNNSTLRRKIRELMLDDSSLLTHPTPFLDSILCVELESLVKKEMDELLENYDDIVLDNTWMMETLRSGAENRVYTDYFEGRIFGFASLEQLFNLIPIKWLIQLETVGAFISEYEVDNEFLSVGSNQVMFKEEGSTRTQFVISEYFGAEIENYYTAKGSTEIN